MKRSMKTIFLLSCLAVLVAARTPAPDYGIGDRVADFRLKNVDGTMVALSDYRDRKGVVVIFDCNTCPYSKAYNQRIIALNEKYSSQGVPVITINSNDPETSEGDSFSSMVAQAKRKNYEFPYLVDETQSVARAFGATNTPHVFVLKNENERFVVTYIGAIDDNPRSPSDVTRKYVEDAVDALLSGGEVERTKTKAIGCGIKWKNA